MAELTITCPHCSSGIPLTESLAAPLLKETRAKYEQALVQKDRDLAAREDSVRSQHALLEQERAAIEEKVEEKIAAERARIAEQAIAKAKRLAAAELASKVQEVAELNELVRDREEKLAAAQEAQA